MLVGSTNKGQRANAQGDPPVSCGNDVSRWMDSDVGGVQVAAVVAREVSVDQLEMQDLGADLKLS